MSHSPSIEELGTLVAEAGEKRNAEIFACAVDTNKIWDGIAAWIRLNVKRGEAMDFNPMLHRLEAALLTLLDRNVIEFALRTPELEGNIQKLRGAVSRTKWAPPAVVTEVVEPLPQGPTEPDLDAAVIGDWHRLPTSDIRSKCRDANYKVRFDRLMNEGRLGR